MANSHGNARIPSGDGTSYKKWCVLCGKQFETVNETRQTCEACQNEIFRKDDLEKARREEKKREGRRKAEENRKRRDARRRAEKKQAGKSSAK